MRRVFNPENLQVYIDVLRYIRERKPAFEIGGIRFRAPVLNVDLLAWLKSEIGLGHVRANFIISYLRLHAKDPKVSTQSKNWANKTEYQELK